VRALYLLRHGQPAFPDGIRLCLGRTDLPLSSEGEAQAAALGTTFARAGWAKLISSPMLRCRATAQAIGTGFEAIEDLTELNMGEWDGKPFSEIKSRWETLYSLRGDDPLRWIPPGGEMPAQMQRRAVSALDTVLADNPGRDILLVGHNAVETALIAHYLNKPMNTLWGDRINYGCVSQILLDGDFAWPGPHNRSPAQLPNVVPDEAECRELLRQCGTPVRATEHCRAVAELAADMARNLNRRGANLDDGAAFAGALLHDIARGKPHHALRGALWLLERGYASMAAIVGDHMNLPEVPEDGWTEKAVVFLADKLIQETHSVSLEERFSRFSDDPVKAPFVQERYEKAKRLLARYEHT